MILNKKTREGWLEIDHRASPGVPGMPKHFEAATITCSHCERIIIRNPDRTRERAWCPKCDKYICDGCEAVRGAQGCRPYIAVIEAQLTKASNIGVI